MYINTINTTEKIINRKILKLLHILYKVYLLKMLINILQDKLLIENI